MTRWSKVFVGSCIAFVVAVMLFLPRWVPWWQSWLTSSPLGESGWSDSGVFGDMFGVANALFSGLALGGVVLAIILQNSELRLQREELALTRFENTFFHMLRLHHEIVAAIQIRRLTAPVHGRECFQDFLKELKSPFKADAIYQTKSPGVGSGKSVHSIPESLACWGGAGALPAEARKCGAAATSSLR